jgi:hypothetical protein
VLVGMGQECGGAAGPHGAGKLPWNVTAQTSVFGLGSTEPFSKSPSCPDAAETKITGVVDICCAVFVAAKTACCCVSPPDRPPQAGTKAIVIKPIAPTLRSRGRRRLTLIQRPGLGDCSGVRFWVQILLSRRLSSRLHNRCGQYAG